MNKKEVRKLIREKRESLSADYINSASMNIFKLLKDSNYLDKLNNIMSYLDFKNEVKTDRINDWIKSNSKKLYLPRVIDKENMIIIEDNGEFSLSPFGNREPIGSEYEGNIDLIIVPGVAFDKFGNRIGFGRGYYDRFFNKYPNAKRVAIAFEIQIVEEIETDIYDKKIDILITEKNIYKFR